MSFLFFWDNVALTLRSASVIEASFDLISGPPFVK